MRAGGRALAVHYDGFLLQDAARTFVVDLQGVRYLADAVKPIAVRNGFRFIGAHSLKNGMEVGATVNDEPAGVFQEPARRARSS